MRRYETIVIADPDLSDEQRDSFFERTTDIISQQGGFLIEFDDWGVRRLAYEIRKKNRGYYVRLDYCGTGDVVSEMERFFRIDDRSLKYMTILLEQQADVEAIKESMTAKETDAEDSAGDEEAEATEDAVSDDTEPETEETVTDTIEEEE
jgi:small subunit ribosomal protein S6